MYSLEEREKAVKLYIQYDFMAHAVIRELGYPKDWRTVEDWYKEYQTLGGHLRKKLQGKRNTARKNKEKMLNII